MSWEALKSAVSAVITDNGNNEITGPTLEALINDNLIPQLGAAKFKGIATTSTNPGTPSSDVFYLASTNGDYPNFGALSLNNEIAAIQWVSDAWVKHTIIENVSKKYNNVFSVWNTNKTVPFVKLELDNIDLSHEYYIFQVGYRVTASSQPNGLVLVIKSIDGTKSIIFLKPTSDRQGSVISTTGEVATYRLSDEIKENITYLYNSLENQISRENIVGNTIRENTIPKHIYSEYNTNIPNRLSELKILGFPKESTYYVRHVGYKIPTSSVPNGCFIVIRDTDGNEYFLKNFSADKKGFAYDGSGRYVAQYEFNESVVDNTNTVYISTHNTLQKGVHLDYELWSNIRLGRWNSKTIWHCGTSIPAGSAAIADDGKPLNYVSRYGTKLMANAINRAIGSSMVRANTRTGDLVGADLDNLVRAMSATNEEKQGLLANWNSYKGDLLGDWTSYTEMPADKQLFLTVSSFETLLTPYLDGTNEMPDLFVLDHGHNDFKYLLSNSETDINLKPTEANIASGELAEDTYMTNNSNEKLISFMGNFNINPAKEAEWIASVNRNCYIGAMNFIITYILKHNPRAKFLIVSNYEDETQKELLIEAQEYIADYWNFPIVKMNEKSQYSQAYVPGTSNFWGDNRSYDVRLWDIYNKDSVHPHSDTTGHAVEEYSESLASAINSI